MDVKLFALISLFCNLMAITYGDVTFERRILNNTENCNFEVWRGKNGKGIIMNNLLLPKEMCWEGAKKMCAWYKMKSGDIRNICDRYVHLKQCFKTKRVLSFLLKYPPHVYNAEVDGARPK